MISFYLIKALTGKRIFNIKMFIYQGKDEISLSICV